MSLKLLRGWISACMRFMSLLGFGTMLANFHMCSIMLVLRAVFNMLVRFYCLLDLSCGECDVIS